MSEASKPFFVRDCMRENPAKILVGSSIFDAIKLIMQHHVSGLTVVDGDNIVRGVISELDCLRGVISSAYDGNARAILVDEVMSTTVDSCSPDEPVFEVAQAMLAKNQRRRPVVKDGKLVGQVSCNNILWAISDFSGVI